MSAVKQGVGSGMFAANEAVVAAQDDDPKAAVAAQEGEPVSGGEEVAHDAVEVGVRAAEEALEHLLVVPDLDLDHVLQPEQRRHVELGQQPPQHAAGGLGL